LLAAAVMAVLAIQVYAFVSMHGAFNSRMIEVENELVAMRERHAERVDQLSSNLDTVAQKIGVTTNELEQARMLAEQYKREQALTAQRLRNELRAKADSHDITELRQEAVTKLQQVEQVATTRIGAVSGEVQVVRGDLQATRTELLSNRRDINDVRSNIARNATELAELKRRDERNYHDFDLKKSKLFNRIADIQIQVKKADVKKQRYDIVLQVDDVRVERKERPVNEPIQFLVGRDQLRYELVVNYVDKDRIRGYVSTPKDKVLSAEGRSFRK
jgi:hypothetical protein